MYNTIWTISFLKGPQYLLDDRESDSVAENMADAQHFVDFYLFQVCTSGDKYYKFQG